LEQNIPSWISKQIIPKVVRSASALRDNCPHSKKADRLILQQPIPLFVSKV
jgi:hypothetical protein